MSATRRATRHLTLQEGALRQHIVCQCRTISLRTAVDLGCGLGEFVALSMDWLHRADREKGLRKCHRTSPTRVWRSGSRERRQQTSPKASSLDSEIDR